MLRIRTLTTADIPLGMHLKAQAGWNQTEQDWRRFLSLSPQGCFVAESAGRGVATVCTFEFGPVGWIAMMLVDQSMRGRGLGTAMMTHALNHLDRRGIRSVRLDATPLGKPVYEKLGFVAQFELTRYSSQGVSPPPPAVPATRPLVSEATSDDLDELIAFDTATTHTPRGRLLRALHAEHDVSLWIARRAGRITGFCSARPGENAVQIGPLLAQAHAGPDLLAKALEYCHGCQVFIDVPDEHATCAALARAAGMRPQRPLTRMCRGEPIRETPDRLWASSGPEKG